jgi:hypothetical protein
VDVADPLVQSAKEECVRKPSPDGGDVRRQ